MKMLGRKVWIAIAAASICASVTAADNLIVPGIRIGPISKAMGWANVKAILGEPTSSIQLSKSGTTQHIFNGHGLSVRISDQSQRVRSVAAIDSRWKTAEGLRVGDSASKVRTTLGRPTEDGGWHFWYPGLYFECPKPKGMVTGIVVD